MDFRVAGIIILILIILMATMKHSETFDSASDPDQICRTLWTIPYAQRNEQQTQQWIMNGCGTRTPYVPYATIQPDATSTQNDPLDKCQKSVAVLQQIAKINEQLESQYSQNQNLYNQIQPIWTAEKARQDNLVEESKYAGDGRIWLDNGQTVACSDLDLSCAGWRYGKNVCGIGIGWNVCSVVSEAQQKCTACSGADGPKCSCNWGWCKNDCRTYQYRPDPTSEAVHARNMWVQNNPAPVPPQIPHYLQPFDVICQQCSATLKFDNVSSQSGPVNISGLDQAINCVQNIQQQELAANTQCP